MVREDLPAKQDPGIYEFRSIDCRAARWLEISRIARARYRLPGWNERDRVRVAARTAGNAIRDTVARVDRYRFRVIVEALQGIRVARGSRSDIPRNRRRRIRKKRLRSSAHRRRKCLNVRGSGAAAGTRT